jgi:hypothetical protein
MRSPTASKHKSRLQRTHISASENRLILTKRSKRPIAYKEIATKIGSEMACNHTADAFAMYQQFRNMLMSPEVIVNNLCISFQAVWSGYCKKANYY